MIWDFKKLRRRGYAKAKFETQILNKQFLTIMIIKIVL